MLTSVKQETLSAKCKSASHKFRETANPANPGQQQSHEVQGPVGGFLQGIESWQEIDRKQLLKF